MRQLTFVDKGRLEWWDVPAPVISDATDALVRPIVVARCDLDYYIATGLRPLPGPFAFGHEATAIVVEVGDSVERVRPGDRVVVPFQISCGACAACRRGHTNACTAVPFRSSFGLAPLSGVDHGGALSDLLRVPFADHMLVRVPESCSPDAAAGAADNVSDGYRAVAEPLSRFPGADVLVVGGLAQSVGLYAVEAALALGATRVVYTDWDVARLSLARSLGAEARPTRYEQGQPVAGSFPVAVEASGMAAGLLLAVTSTAPCGICTVVATLDPTVGMPLPAMYGSGVELRVGRAQARAVMPDVLEQIGCGRLRPETIVSRRVPFDDAADAMTDGSPKLLFIAEPC